MSAGLRVERRPGHVEIFSSPEAMLDPAMKKATTPIEVELDAMWAALIAIGQAVGVTIQKPERSRTV